MSLRLGVVPVGHDDGSAPAGCPALRPLRGVPLVRWAVDTLVRARALDAVVVATPPSVAAAVASALSADGGTGPAVEVLLVQENGPGLRLRAALRGRGLGPDDVVLVHDPLFPLASVELVRAVVGALGEEPDGAGPDGVVPVRPVTDTLKRVNDDDVVTGTVDREEFRVLYSPQAYRAGPLTAALDAAEPAALRGPGTDVLPRLVQADGGWLASVQAPGEVFRVATVDDLVLAEAMLDPAADLEPSEVRPSGAGQPAAEAS